MQTKVCMDLNNDIARIPQGEAREKYGRKSRQEVDDYDASRFKIRRKREVSYSNQHNKLDKGGEKLNFSFPLLFSCLKPPIQFSVRFKKSLFYTVCPTVNKRA